jgi:RimJ/RimL family protein N-acetyltransferase
LPRALLPNVRVTRLRPDHAEAMFAWMQDPEVSRNLGLRNEPSIEKTRGWITRALEDSQTCAFAIELDGRHIGNVVFDHIDRYLSNARLSVYIGDIKARGTGAGFTGMYLAIREAFVNLGLNKIWLIVHTQNTRAIAAYVKLGFQVEGLIRDDFRLDGQLVPTFHMGLLRRDFEKLSVPEAST